MKNILEIVKTDIRNILKKKQAIVVIVALMFLPSMYAWFNIIPSWDPYSNTSGVAVAVVNKDNGTSIDDEAVNVGDKVIEALTDNTQLGWDFVEEEEGLRGVEKGKYYATIIIPDDFSKNLTSVLDNKPKQSVIDYHINEKINAIAPKVTGAGASGVVEKIHNNFVKVVNETIFTAFNDIGIEIESNKDSIKTFRDAIYQMEADLPEIERIINLANRDVDKVENSLVKVNEGVDRAEEVTAEAELLSKRIAQIMQRTDETVDKYIPLVRSELSSAQSIVQQIPRITQQVASKDADVDKLLDQVADGAEQIDSAVAALDLLVEILETLDQGLNEEAGLEHFIEELESTEKHISNLLKELKKMLDQLEDGSHPGIEIAKKINQEAEAILEQVDRALDKFDESTAMIEDILAKTLKYIDDIPEILEIVIGLNDDLINQIEEWLEAEGPLTIDEQLDLVKSLKTGVKAANKQIKAKISKIEEEIDNNEEDALLKTYLERLQGISDSLLDLEESLKEAEDELKDGENISIEFLEKLLVNQQEIKVKLEEFRETTQEIIRQIKDYQEVFPDKSQEVKDGLLKLQKIMENDIVPATKELVDLANNPEEAILIIKKIIKNLEEADRVLNKLIKISKDLDDVFASGFLKEEVSKIQAYIKQLKSFKGQILKNVSEAQDVKEITLDVLKMIEAKSVEIDTSITEITRFINGQLLPKYEEARAKANYALTEGDKILSRVQEYFPEVHDLLVKLDDSLDTGKDSLAMITESFPEVKDKLKDIAERVRDLEAKGDLDSVINMLRNDPSAEGEFFANPILLQEHEIFPIPNYGSAMAPFFTAMSLWVGGLILVSSLIVDVPNKERYKSYETYFGRILTFWFIGLMQSLIVSLGNLYLLKTFVAHPFWYTIFGFIISIVFVTIIYTLVSVFGNTGKVISIILLVMQLGASGGTFPIQMTPKFFQNIHLFLPFTHALNLFREAVGGIIWPVAIKYIIYLIIYMIIFLFIGIKLKATINKSSDKFLKEARESEIIL